MYKQHNAALKYFREVHEDLTDPFSSVGIHFNNDAPSAVAEIDHDSHGMQWGWKDSHVLWSWQEMVAQLNDGSMDLVVNGLDGRSGGLLGCSFLIRPNSYDHQRHHQLNAAGKPCNTKLPI